MKELDAARTIVAIGNYGYDWAGKRSGPRHDLPGDGAGGEGSRRRRSSSTPKTLNPHFDYQEDDGSIHHVWFLDAVTAHNQIRAADTFRPAGYALWRLGSEDPSIWSLFGTPYDAPIPEE